MNTASVKQVRTVVTWKDPQRGKPQSGQEVLVCSEKHGVTFGTYHEYEDAVVNSDSILTQGDDWLYWADLPDSPIEMLGCIQSVARVAELETVIAQVLRGIEGLGEGMEAEKALLCKALGKQTNGRAFLRASC